MSNFWLWFICPKCKGRMVSRHANWPCSYCKGKGRVTFWQWMAWDQ